MMTAESMLPKRPVLTNYRDFTFPPSAIFHSFDYCGLVILIKIFSLIIHSLSKKTKKELYK